MNKRTEGQDLPQAMAGHRATDAMPKEGGIFDCQMARSIPAGVFLADADGVYTCVNERWCEIAGIPTASALSGGWEQAIHPDDREKVVNAWLTSVKDGRHFFMEYRFRHRNGMVRWVQQEVAAERDAAGKPAGYIGIVTDITLGKQAEDEYQRFFNLVPDLACVASADGRFLKINAMWQETLGYTAQELLSMPFMEFIHPDDRDATMEQVKQQLAGKPTLYFTNRYRCKDGSYKWLEWKATPAVDGKLLFASARDITERRQMEETTQEVLERLNKIASQVPGIVYQFRMRPDGSYCVPYASEAAREIYRIDPEEVREDAFKVFAYAHPDDLEAFKASILKSAQELAPWQHEYRLKFDDGTVRWVYGNAIPQREADGSTLWHGFLTDITGRKQNEERIRQSEARLHAYLDNISDTIWLIDANLDMAYVSSGVTRLLGVLPEELVGRPSAMVVHPDDMEVVSKAQQHVIEHPGVPHTAQYRVRHKDGRWIHVESTGVNMLDNPEIGGVLVTMRDITERKQTEDLLRFHSEILLNLPEGVVLTRAGDGMIVFVNPRFEQMFGYGTGELPGKHVSILNAPGDKSPEAVAETIMADLGRTGKWNGEIRNVRKDGTAFWCQASVMVFDHPQFGQVWTAVHENITERKAAEDRLRLNEASMRAILDNSPYLVWLKDTEGRYITSNVTHIKYAQLNDHNEIVGKTDFDLWPKELAEKYRADDAEVIASRRQKHVEEPSFDGKRMHWVETYKTPIIDETGKVIGTTGFAYDITERKQAEQILAESESRFREIFNAVSDAIFIHDAETGRIIDVNRRMCEMYGVTREEAFACGPDDLSAGVPPYSAAEAIEKIHLARTAGPQTFDWLARTPGGRYFWVEVSLQFAVIGDRQRILAVVRDISERKHTDAELRIAAIAFESQDGMVVTDAHNVILRVNHAFTEITGYTAEEAVGQTPRLLKSGRHDAAFYAAMWDSILRTGTWHGEIWNRRKNGEIHPEQLTITAVKEEAGKVTHYVATLRDITERKAAEEEIHNLAFYDALTGLPNRRLLDDRLGQVMAASKRSGLHGALMFLDLDNFKPLNDTYGHDIGDLLLRDAARRIASCVREADTVARFGGDEFVVVLGELEESKDESRTQTGIVAEKIRAILDKPYMLKFQREGKTETSVLHRCSSSIGVALFINHEAAPEDILKWADIAMYQAKEAGGNRVHFYAA